MSELLSEIKSRGHWKVIIRPSTFVEKRVEHHSSLRSILERNSVESKGWSFPHISSNVGLESGSDWIGQEFSFGYIREFWRFYKSGQLVHYYGFPAEWGSTFNQWLPSNDDVDRVVVDVVQVITRCTEILEFAARLSLTEAGDSEAILEITVDNLENHFLQLPVADPGKAQCIREAREPHVKYKRGLPRHELVAETRELALQPSLEVFKCFGWKPEIGVLRDLQDKWLEKRPMKVG